MGDCVIDYCGGGDEKILTVTTAEPQVIRLGFCREHAGALRDRFAAQLGVQPQHVDLTKFGGTVGELQEAVEYLDEQAALENSIREDHQ